MAVNPSLLNTVSMDGGGSGYSGNSGFVSTNSSGGVNHEFIAEPSKFIEGYRCFELANDKSSLCLKHINQYVYNNKFDNDYALYKKMISSIESIQYEVNEIFNNVKLRRKFFCNTDGSFEMNYWLLLDDKRNTTTNFANSSVSKPVFVNTKSYDRQYSSMLIEKLEQLDDNNQLDKEGKAVLLQYKCYMLEEELKYLNTNSMEYYAKQNEMLQLYIKYYQQRIQSGEVEFQSIVDELKTYIRNNIQLATFYGKLSEQKEIMDKTKFNSIEFFEAFRDYLNIQINFYNEHSMANTSEFQMLVGVRDEVVIAINQMQAEIEKRKQIQEEYDNMGDFQKILQNVWTVISSLVVGVLDLVEVILDGALTLSYFFNYNRMTLSVLFPDLAAWNDKTFSTVVGCDWTSELYKFMTGGVNELIAYSDVSTYTSMAGTLAASIALSILGFGVGEAFGALAGMVVGGGLGGLAASGATTENALHNGANVDQAVLSGTAAFAIGFLSAACVETLGGSLSYSSSFVQKVMATFAGGIASGIEPVLSSMAEYYIYIADTNMYENYADYFEKSGKMNEVSFAATAGIVSVGLNGFIRKDEAAAQKLLEDASKKLRDVMMNEPDKAGKLINHYMKESGLEGLTPDEVLKFQNANKAVFTDKISETMVNYFAQSYIQVVASSSDCLIVNSDIIKGIIEDGDNVRYVSSDEFVNYLLELVN